MKNEEIIDIITYKIKIYNIISFNKNKIFTKIFLIILIIVIYNVIGQLVQKYSFLHQRNLSKLIYKKIENIELIEEYLNNNNLNYYNKTNINICMGIDNNYIYPTLVSMTSALENNNKDKNILVYYLFISFDIEKDTIQIFESLKEKYEVIIYYYIIPNIFKYFRKWDSNTYGIYYKLLIPFILNKLKRIIFLDADTLIFDDILEMYNLPFNDNYILGYPFHTPDKLDKFGIYSVYYINGGILLMNIEKIIKDNKHKDLMKFTYENNYDLVFLEQDSINYILFKKIGFLPLKYGIYLYGNITNYKANYEKDLRVKLNISEINNAINNPSIIHFCCCGPKIWNKNTKHNEGIDNICIRFQKEFYYYANKTNYYKLIYSKYMN